MSRGPSVDRKDLRKALKANEPDSLAVFEELSVLYGGGKEGEKLEARPAVLPEPWPETANAKREL